MLLDDLGGDEVFDCTDCGACCRCFPIFASAGDAEREPKIKERGVYCEDFLGEKGRVAYRLYPLLNTKGCAFLQENQLCSVYATRPGVCRIFEAGSDQCVRARARVGVGTRR